MSAPGLNVGAMPTLVIFTLCLLACHNVGRFVVCSRFFLPLLYFLHLIVFFIVLTVGNKRHSCHYFSSCFDNISLCLDFFCRSCLARTRWSLMMISKCFLYQLIFLKLNLFLLNPPKTPLLHHRENLPT